MNERMREKIYTSVVTATPDILCFCTWQNLNFQLKMSEIRNLNYFATLEWLIDACEENCSLISNSFQSC